jgi:transposase
MRPPAKIHKQLRAGQLAYWVRIAPDLSTYKKRLTIWMLYLYPLYAQEVAKILRISKQSVWKWTSEYNKYGRFAFIKNHRGGRRWHYYLSEERERILMKYIRKSVGGNPIKAKKIHPIVEELIGHKVSLAYVYKLLRRNRR